MWDARNWVRDRQCRKKAVIERDGVWYCKIHDPEYIREKREKAQQEYERKIAGDRARYGRQWILQDIGEGFENEFLKSHTARIREYIESLKENV